MRLEDCEIEGIGGWSMAPLQRSEAEPDWISASEKGVIPVPLMRLYTRANFLSFGTSPPFPSDANHQLFSYFALMLRGLKGSLSDADEELAEFDQAEAKVYDPGKQARGEQWDTAAPSRSKKHFRLVLLSLCSSLDCIAELTALLLPDSIPGLKLGKADFMKIEDWLKSDAPALTGIVSPQQVQLRKLHEALAPIVESQGEEREWLSLAKLLRNKAAHLGTEHFREMGFHDKNLVFYSFLPKKWPLLWEEHIGVTSGTNDRLKAAKMDAIVAPLMRQDKVSYLHGLRTKITSLVDAAVNVLDSVFADNHNFAVNVNIARNLKEAAKEYAFRAFPT
jgi:hypothetical protein